MLDLSCFSASRALYSGTNSSVIQWDYNSDETEYLPMDLGYPSLSIDSSYYGKYIIAGTNTGRLSIYDQNNEV